MTQFREKTHTQCDIAVGDKNIVLFGDLKFIFFDRDKLRQNRMFSFCFNTAFVKNSYICFTRDELDGAYKVGQRVSPVPATLL